ncbi:MAG TPA: aminomethyltransferase beta-barrel domain-containing protein, partial [Longimicrobiaceae bacterium]
AALSTGALVTTSGEMIGEHDGYARYTVGQRRGLGGGRSLPLYVLGTRPERREVVVGTAEELHRPDVSIGELNWLAVPPAVGDAVQVQIRHRAPAVAATVEAIDGGAIELRFARPQRAVSPGQSAVIFSGEVVLGGGRIASDR